MKSFLSIGLTIIAALGLFIAQLVGAFRFFPAPVLGHVTAAYIPLQSIRP